MFVAEEDRRRDQIGDGSGWLWLLGFGGVACHDRNDRVGGRICRMEAGRVESMSQKE